MMTKTVYPQLLLAAAHLRNEKLALAKPLVELVLKQHPSNASALRLLATIYIRAGRYPDAQKLLESALELTPDCHLARNNYAVVLLQRQDLTEALEQAEILLQYTPQNPRHLALKATILRRMGNHQAALQIFEQLLERHPRQAAAQLSYGHILKTVGRLNESIAAYRRAIEMGPATGEAYWSLANLKTFRFSDGDINTMREAIASPGRDNTDQSYLAFAMGKALEDRELFDESFKYYRAGNLIKEKKHFYDSQKNTHKVVSIVKTCTEVFFAQRKAWGCPAQDPIFIVGLPRAGSTLLEQVLASHSQVEGTTELPDIIEIVRNLGGGRCDNSIYPEILAQLSAQQLLELGESYLESTRIQRKTTTFFIDKMPNNFLHIGLIHLILPNAKIIDARRHPMATCFSAYKQLFARGQNFSYKLSDVGHYYRDYIKLMDHWNEVLPGRVLRVQYEDMVAAPETQIRRILSYCKLPFEPQCLQFYNTKRAIQTPSAEQVRQPIYQHSLEQWRNFEAQLTPLKEALGPLLQRYSIN